MTVYVYTNIDINAKTNKVLISEFLVKRVLLL